MSSKVSANYITARDLFLAHHWKRYPAFDRKEFDAFFCGRVVSKEDDRVRLQSTRLESRAQSSSIAMLRWASLSLKEPKAAESVSPVREVVVVGDWIGIDPHGSVILFAPCSQFGTTAVEAADVFVTRAQAWANFLSEIRGFFSEHSFLEMTTPTLAVSPGTEPFLDPLSVSMESNGVLIEKYLITSPEFHLKKALAAGLPRIFEIAKCFRDREGGPHHRIEFHMLEWYRAFASVDEIADDVETLILRFDPSRKLHRATMSEIFLKFTESRLEATSTREDLAITATRLRIRFTDDDDFNDLFHRIFLDAIEPKLDELTKGDPLLISSYPPSMAALARLRPDGFADRFEVYWKGLEICNAFHELNDPAENRQRFESDRRVKEFRGKDVVPVDEELLKAFDLGVPPAGGIALGLERLFMALYDQPNIESVRPFLKSP